MVLAKYLVFNPTPTRTNWATRGTNNSTDWESITSMQRSRVSHIGEPFAIDIRRFSSFSVCIPTFAACNWDKEENRRKGENIENEKKNKIMFQTITSTKAISETTEFARPQRNLTLGLLGLISFQACSRLGQVDVAEVQHPHPAIIEQPVKRTKSDCLKLKRTYWIYASRKKVGYLHGP